MSFETLVRLTIRPLAFGYAEQLRTVEGISLGCQSLGAKILTRYRMLPLLMVNCYLVFSEKSKIKCTGDRYARCYQKIGKELACSLAEVSKMLKGIYTPLSGAVTQERVLEVLSNNLANLNTTGFKGDKVSFEVLIPEPNQHYKSPLPPANYKYDFNEILPLRGNEIKYVGVSQIERDQTQGPVVTTRNPTDLMIEGRGYFTVMTTEGLRYSRDGALSLNSEGVLSTKVGAPVLGEKGNIYLRSGQFEVNGLGEIYQDGQLVDRLRIVDVKDPKAFERAGNNLLIHSGPETDIVAFDSPVIRQGQLEGSNVNAIQNMTALIMAHRSFEAYQKAVQNFDSMMDRSSNSIGEIRA